MQKKMPQGGNKFIALRHETYSGPLPAPEDLQKYENVLPGAAERILALAEKQADHRIFKEQYALRKSTAIFARGQIFGFILALLLVIVGVVFAFAGFPKLAAVIFSGTMVSAVAIFVMGRKDIKKPE